MTKQECVLVTGAGAGIGREITRQFLERGAKVLAVSRSQSGLDQLQSDFNPPAGQLAVLSLDLSNPDAAQQLFDWCEQEKWVVDVLVNNAGYACFGDTIELEAEKLTRMLVLNCVTVTQLCRLFGAQMKTRGSGSILNVGSTAGMVPMSRFASYGGSKSYVNNFSYALRAELAPYGVNVTCLTPGIVQTKFAHAAGIDNFEGKSMLKDVFAKNGAATPESVAEAGIKGMYAKKAQVLTGKGARMAQIACMLVPPSMLPRFGKNL